MRPLLYAGLAALSIALPLAEASAGQIQATSYSVVGGGVNAHISYSGSPSISNEYVNAGELSLTVHDLPSGSDRTLLAWCTDIFDLLYVPAAYDVGVLTTDRGKTGSALSTTVFNEINALISHGTALLAASFSKQVSSAIQLAIWSVEYGSKFSFTSDDPSVAGLVSTYVGNVSGSSPVWTADSTKVVAQITT